MAWSVTNYYIYIAPKTFAWSFVSVKVDSDVIAYDWLALGQFLEVFRF